jgi:hypothetical protein
MFDAETWRKSLKELEKKEEEKKENKIGFDAWIDDMEEQEQPTCNVDNPEDCENCGS